MSDAQYGPDFWDEFYRGDSTVWSGAPNQVLVEEVAGLPPGRALDVGAGEGADAVWLARNGWRVTAVDISRVALDRAAAHAREYGEELGSRIDWWCADVTTTAPERAAYDLVTAFYFHLPLHPRANALRGLAASVAPGGTLLVVGHDPRELELLDDPDQGPSPDSWFMPEEIAALLDARVFDLQTATIRSRTAPTEPANRRDEEHDHGHGHDHGGGHSADVVVRARRRT
ncbi:class I SAM-dependent methyltransferase [Spiractinospora alimapuensis]|uniref:class I SAM-dependent methyltransferase n=1 Tax=Spiractinospora alimapuensis TaxID=2820884 RepID=UPI001F2A2A62|nr:class I SAM-dependent methyltransferase [Spiractinospora alimapuensis]QVQ53915.1 class I SAM-dependent methyltransferase [Spiractinospora alimapuensis]